MKSEDWERRRLAGETPALPGGRGGSTHSSQEFSCSVARQRLMGTYVGAYGFFQLEFNDHTLSEEIFAPSFGPKNSTPRLCSEGKVKSVNTRSPSFTKTSSEQASTK